MKKELLKIGTFCFGLGLLAGYFITPEAQKLGKTETIFLKMSSQGRSEIEGMVQKINEILTQDIGEITAEKTRMLQAITAREPDRTAANFYLSGMESKMSQTQAKISKTLLDTVERMPLIDRREYMRFYLNLRPCLRTRSVVLPILTRTSDELLDKCNLTPLLPTVKPL